MHAGLQLLLPAAALHADASDSRNWFALVVFLVTAVVVSELAAGLRRRATESALLADIATSLARPRGRRRAAREAASRSWRARSRSTTPSRAGRGQARGSTRSSPGERPVGAIALEGTHTGTTAARRRLLPALGSLVGVAVDRERLAREAVEAEALRRSDALKTAVLRAVSHDLRTPLMAILTSASALSRADLDLEAADREELLAHDPARGRASRSAGRRPARPLAAAGRGRHTEPAPCAIDDLVVQALRDMGSRAERVEVTLPDHSPVAKVDAQQVERALVNLIENALKLLTRGRARPRAGGSHGSHGSSG